MYNYTMGSPPLPDLLGQYYGQPDPYGPSTSTQFPYDTIGTTGMPSTFNRTSPISRRRRYSIGGLPSATMTDLYNFSTQNISADSSAVHIANLLNETSKSISRSTQILNQRLGRAISSYPELNISEPSYLNDNLMQMSTSFSSQPNICFQPYSSTFDKTSGQAGGTAAASTTQSYLSRLRPTLSSSHLNYLYQRPSLYTSSFNPYITSNFQSQPQSQNILYQRNLMPSLHASNPAFTTSHTSYHHPSLGLHHFPNHQQHQFHQLQQQQQQYLHPSHLQQQIQQQLPPHQYHLHQYQQPFSSGYTSQHFDHLHQQLPYQVPLSKIDLDYTKPPETKRQVSFKFDVDTLSIDS